MEPAVRAEPVREDGCLGSGLVEVRHPGTGKLVCMYDPDSHRMQFRQRGETFWLDLTVLQIELGRRLQPPALT